MVANVVSELSPASELILKCFEELAGLTQHLTYNLVPKFFL